MPIPGLKTRKPTGAVPWPFILVEGEEKAGKSWVIAEFTKSERTGTLYWIDLNEGAADEYGAIPGADYEVVEHSGSYADLLNAVELIHAEAKRAALAGEPPVVLAIDSGTAIWNGLKDWATERAMKSESNKRALARDPNAEVTITSNLWNDAGSRWRKIQTLLMTFPGIAIITARGKDVVEIKNGAPVNGSRVWAVESHKELPFSATVWLRMKRDENPEIIGARSVHAGIKPGADRPKKIQGSAWDGRLLEWLVFDVLKCDPATSHVRDLKEFHGGELMEHEKADEAAAQAPAQPAAGPVARARQGRQQEPKRGKTPEQWQEAVAAATSREEMSKLHAEAEALGELTQGLLQAMQARVKEINAAAAAEPGNPAGDDEGERQLAVAEQAPDGAEAEAERRAMLVDELKMQAEIIVTTPAKLTERTLPQGPKDVPIEKLQKVVADLRGLTIAKLRSTGRGAEADAYAQVKDTEWDIPSGLLGTAGEADKAA